MGWCLQVLVQEVHIPVVSTQKLYIPCPAPERGSWAEWASVVFDTSVLAQSVLRVIAPSLALNS
jgi:hypothetical protein